MSTEVYATAFSPVDGLWSTSGTIDYEGDPHLGPFGNSAARLQLADLPPHAWITGTLEVWLRYTWDGNQVPSGPDHWLISVDNTVLLDTTFSNWQTYRQSYPDPFPSDHPSGTGAIPGSLRNGNSARYRIPFAVQHTAPNLTLRFSAAGLLGDLNDESWAIDDVDVWVSSAPPGGTLVIDSDTTWAEPSVIVGTLVVTDDATLTILNGSPVSADSIVVGPGARISADDQQTADLGGGGQDGAAAQGGSGGSYGGFGGLGTGGQNYGMPYGSALDPGDPGSPGGDAPGLAGGAGGGALILSATETIRIDGAISAAGGAGETSAQSASGGGAGGSIKLQAPLISGNGMISAVGGGGGGGSTGIRGGAGSGGRIALHTDALAFTGEYNASGGDASAAAAAGGPGTIVLERDAWRTLRVDNAPASRSAAALLPEQYVFDEMVIGPATALTLLDDAGVLDISGATLDIAADATLRIEGTLVAPETWPVGFQLISASGLITTAPGLAGNPESRASLLIDGGGSVALTYGGSPLGAVTVADGGRLRLQANETASGQTLAVDRLEVQTGGVVESDGLGFAAGSGPGAGWRAGDGGSHGGIAQRDIALADGSLPTYGDTQHPDHPGSGGFGACGGAGGGMVRIVARDALIVHGIASASGRPATDACGAVAGGGAGGSIWLQAPTISGAGTISAGGGAGALGGLGGSGGRVAVYGADAAFTGAIQALGADSAPGTVYRDNGVGTTLLIAPGGSLPAVANGALPGLDTVIVSPTASILFPAGLALDKSLLGGGTVVVRGALSGQPTESLDGVDIVLYGGLETIRALQIGSGATLTVDAARLPAGVLDLDALTIDDGALIVDSAFVGSAGSLADRGATIRAAAVAIGEDGRISASGRGYRSPFGLGPGGNGSGLPHGGASHGGAPWDGQPPAGRPSYGDPYHPQTLGSATPQNAGGGALRLAITNTLELNGRIEADGRENGAGGSIWISADELSGGGTLSAVGAGFSAGGRIAVYRHDAGGWSGQSTVSGGADCGGASCGGSLIAAALDPLLTTVALTPSISIADGVTTATLRIVAADFAGAPLGGLPLEARVNGSGLIDGQPAANWIAIGSTSSSGELTRLLTSSLTGTSEVEIRGGPLSPVAARAQMEWFGAPDAQRSSLTAQPARIAADGQQSAQIRVVVRDTTGAPVPGVRIRLATTTTGVTLTQPLAPTDRSGVATGQLRSAADRQIVVTAQANGLALVDTATVDALGADSRLGLHAAEPFVIGRPATYTLAISNAGLLTADAVLLTLRLPSGVSFVGQDSPITPTQTGGELRWDWGALAAGEAPPAITVRTRIAAGIAPGSILTATATLTTASFERNTSNNSAAAAAVAAPGFHDGATVVAAPGLLPADGSSGSVVTVRVLDWQGQPLAGRTIELAIDPAAGSTLNGAPITGWMPIGPTDASGVVSATLRATTPGPRQVRARAVDGTGIAATATVTFINAPLDPARSRFVSDKARVAADGSSSALLTITALDTMGNPVAGAQVAISGSGPGVISAASPTDASGRTTATIASAERGATVLQASVEGSVINQHATVTFRSFDLGAELSAPAQSGLSQLITYTMTIRNLDLLSPISPTIVFTMPLGTELVAANTLVPPAIQGRTLTWTLAGPQAAPLILAGTVVVRAPAAESALGQTLTAELSATAAGVDEDPANNARSRATTLHPADLALAVAAQALSNDGLSPSIAVPGSPVTYTLTLANAGFSSMPDAVLTTTLAPELDLATLTSSLAATREGRTLTWHLGGLAPGAQRSLTVRASLAANAAGPFSQVFHAAAGVPEATGGNNHASWQFSVSAPAPRLALAPSAPAFELAPGASASLTVTVRNTGLGPLEGLIVASPTHLPWVTTWTTPNVTLPPGATALVRVEASIPPGQRDGVYRDLVLVGNASYARPLGLSVSVPVAKKNAAVRVINDLGSPVAQAQVVVARRGGSIVVTEGVTATYPLEFSATASASGAATFADLPLGTYDYRVTAAHHAAGSGMFTVDGGPSDPVTLRLTAQPALAASPLRPVIAARPGSQGSTVISIANPGAAPLEGLSVSAPATLRWVYLALPESGAAISPTGMLEFTVFAAPPADQAYGIYQDYIDIQAGGLQQRIALSVEVTAIAQRDLAFAVTSVDGGALPPGASMTLVRQEESQLVTAGVTTTFHAQFVQPVAGGQAIFPALPLGDYGYTAHSEGYDVVTGTLTVQAGTAAQTATAALTPAPFNYSWEVTPNDQGYDIELTLTYDTAAPAPGALIPQRHWSFATCQVQAINDQLLIHNPTAITLTLETLDFAVPGVTVARTDGAGPLEIGPHQSAMVPVRADRTGSPGQGGAQARITYRRAPDRQVTFTFNPSSRTSEILSPTLATYTDTFALSPVLFTRGITYAIEVEQPEHGDWRLLPISSTVEFADLTDTLPFTLDLGDLEFLNDGAYVDRARVTLHGADGAQRSGSLLINVLKSAAGIQVHTDFVLGPLPLETAEFTASATIYAGDVSCGVDGGGGGASGGGWTWSALPGGGLSGHWSGGGGGGGTSSPGVPGFPGYIPPPVYSYDHQQVRVTLDQRVMLEGEGFHASLQINNTSAAPLENLMVTLQISDENGLDATGLFTVTPLLPTNFGTVALGASAGKQWFVLPDRVHAQEVEGRTFRVRALMTYRWNGVLYTSATAAEEITVLPAPRLDIDYQLPLTQATCQLFELKATITNVGAGPARNLRFRSAQPRLSDPASGLPLGFAIVAVLVNGESAGLSLDQELGELAPGNSATISWFIRASQPGRFVEFTSQFRHSNYQNQLAQPLLRAITTRFVEQSSCSTLPINPIAGDTINEPGVRANTLQQAQVFVGGPINIGSGNYIYSQQDTALTVRGGPFAFRRIYSRDRLGWPEDETMGPGWTHNLNVRLYFDPNDDVRWRYGVVFQQSNGSRQKFNGWRPNIIATPYYIEYAPETGLLASLERREISDGIFEYTVILTLDRTRYLFDNDGYLLRIDSVPRDTSQLWNAQILTYEPHPITPTLKLLSSWRDGGAADARGLLFDYDGQGLLRAIRDQRSLSDAQAPATTLDYANGLLTAVTDVNGGTWAYTYTQRIETPRDKEPDEQGRPLLTEVRNPLGDIVEAQHFNPRGCAVEQKDGRGDVIVHVIYPDDRCDQTNERTINVIDHNVAIAYTYQGGLQIRQKLDPGSGLVENHTDYDHNGRLMSHYDWLNNRSTEVWSYDGTMLDAMIDPEGHRTDFIYDPAFRNLLSRRDALGATTIYTYAHALYPLLLTDQLGPDGSLIHNEYSAAGFLERTQARADDGSWLTTAYVYDGLGQRIREVRNVVGADPATVAFDPDLPGQNLVTTFDYDELGRLTAATDYLGSRTTYAYDAYGHLTDTVKNHVDGIFDPAQSDQDLASRIEYDEAFRMTAQIDSVSGHLDTRTAFGYDAASYLRTQTISTTGETRTATFDYNIAGDAVQTRNAQGQRTVTCFDALRNPRRMIQNTDAPYPAACDWPRGQFSAAADVDQVTDTTFSPNGMPLSTLDPLGRQTTFGYDKRNQLVTSLHNANGSAAEQELTEIWYDAVGSPVLTRVSRKPSQLVCYDSLRRPVIQVLNPTLVTFPAPGAPADVRATCAQLAAGGYAADPRGDRDVITRFVYNRLGQQVAQIDPRGVETRIAYDPLDRVAGVIANAQGAGVYDPATPDLNVTVRLTHDLLAGGWGSGFTSSEAALYTTSASVPGLRNRVVYDRMGREWLSFENFNDSFFDPTRPAEDVMKRLTYDGAGRVVASADSAGRINTQRYTFFGEPARGVLNDVDGAYSAAQPDQDLATESVVAFGRVLATTNPLGRRTTYSYDSSGRVATQIANYSDGVFAAAAPDRDLLTRYAYDKVGRLIGQEDHLGRIDWTCYDALDRPVRMILGVSQGPLAALVARDPAEATHPCNAAYLPTHASDQDVVTTLAYATSAAGGLAVTTTRLNHGAPVAADRREYDAFERLAVNIRNVGDGVHTAADPSDRDVLAIAVYDKNGNQLRSVDASGRETWRCYDALNRPTRQIVNVQAWSAPATELSLAIVHARVLPEANSPLHPCSAAYTPASGSDIDLLTRYAYDQRGNLTSVVDTLNRRTMMEYDGLSNVTQVIRNVDASGSADRNVRTEIRYALQPAGSGRQVMVVDTTDFTRARVAAQRVSRTVYDQQNRPVRVINNYQPGAAPSSDVNVTTAQSYNGLGSVVAATDANGFTSHVGYDWLERQIWTSNPLTQTTFYDYAPGGGLAAVRAPEQRTTRFGYDRLYRRISETSPLDFTRHIEYDQHGRVVAQIDANGIRTSFAYDALDQLLGSIENDKAGPPNQRSQPDRNLETQYTYDVRGNMVRVDLPQGAYQYQYDGLNQRTTIDGPLLRDDVWQTVYDRAGRLDLTTAPGNAEYPATQLDYVYDQLDRLTNLNSSDAATADVVLGYDGATAQPETMRDGWGTTDYRYDALERLTEVTDPERRAIGYRYDAGGRLDLMTLPTGAVDYDYDSANRLRQIRDWSNRTTTYTYDSADRLDTATLPDGTAVDYAYDTNDRLTLLDYQRDGQTLFRAAYTAFDNEGNRLQAVELAPLPTLPACIPVGEAEQSTQTGSGLVAFAARRDDESTLDIYVMNADGRNACAPAPHPANDTEPAWSPNGQEIAFISDRSGAPRLYAMQANGGQLRMLADISASMPAWSPDGARIAFVSTTERSSEIYVLTLATGRLQRLTTNDVPDTNPVWANDWFVIYVTARRGQRDIVARPLGFALTINLVTGPTDDYAPAWSAAAQTLAFVSTRNGQPDVYTLRLGQPYVATQITNDPWEEIRIGWDSAGQCIVFAAFDPNAGSKRSQLYGQLAQPGQPRDVLTHSFASAIEPTWAPMNTELRERTIDYAYDERYRLAGATYSLSGAEQRSYEYQYDLMGNVIRSTAYLPEVVETTSSYDPANRLIDSRSNDNSWYEYTYDPAGNLRQERNVRTSAATSYAYDGAQRLVSVTQPDGAATLMAYNGRGDRYRRTDAAGSVTYALDYHGALPQVVGEFGAETRWYLTAGNTTLGMQRNGSWYTYLHDGQGSVRQYLASDGTRVASQSYDPYGATIERAGQPWAPAQGYTGEITDPTGDIYLRARFYNPGLRSFLNRDPVLGVPGRSATYNGYGYVEGNPINSADPSGAFAIGVLGWVAIATLTAAFSFGAHSIIVGQNVRSFADLNRINWHETGRWSRAGAAFGFELSASFILSGLIGPRIIGTLGNGIVKQVFVSTLIEGTIGGGARVGANLIAGREWHEGVPGSILMSSVFGFATGMVRMAFAHTVQSAGQALFKNVHMRKMFYNGLGSSGAADLIAAHEGWTLVKQTIGGELLDQALYGSTFWTSSLARRVARPFVQPLLTRFQTWLWTRASDLYALGTQVTDEVDTFINPAFAPANTPLPRKAILLQTEIPRLAEKGPAMQRALRLRAMDVTLRPPGPPIVLNTAVPGVWRQAFAAAMQRPALGPHAMEAGIPFLGQAFKERAFSPASLSAPLLSGSHSSGPATRPIESLSLPVILGRSSIPQFAAAR